MEKLKLNLFLATGILLAAIVSCQKSEIEQLNSPQKSSVSIKKAPVCNPLYALVLSSGTGSPVPAGLKSFIFKVDLCSSPVGYGFVSQIMIGTTAVTDVTGICDMYGVADYAWAVTGANSNFPKRLLKVQISTGAAGIASTTVDASGAAIALQDIENFGTTGLFVAIKEGTSQLMKVAVPGGGCGNFAPLGPTNQYNGLTVVGNNFHVISGLTSSICSPNTGDIFEYPSTGGSYTAKYSYKNLSANATWTMKELGFYYSTCCDKLWVVGSSSNIISHNTNITPCVLPNPTFLLNTSTTGQNYFPIYDFMAKP